MTRFVDCHASELSGRKAITTIRLSGYRRIGKGSFGQVHAHPDDASRVVKIGRYDSGDTYEGGSRPPMDGWLDYVLKFDGSRSRHKLRVHRVELHRDFYIATIERLQKGSRRDKTHETVIDTCEWHFGSPSEHPGSLGRFGRRLEALYGESYDYSLDCHSGNVMFRADGTAVFSDPVCFSNWVRAHW